MNRASRRADLAGEQPRARPRRGPRKLPALAAAVTCALGLAACGGASTQSGAAGNGSTPLKLTSSAFAGGANLPVDYSCSGSNLSPPLAWGGHASSWAVTLTDVDVPTGTGVLWVVTGLHGSTHRLVAGELPAGAVASRRSDGGTGYYGPCPPTGTRHRYEFKVSALSGPLNVAVTTSASAAFTEIAAKSPASASLQAVFAR